MSSPSALRWRSVAPGAIAWREWDGEYVVRNERSGNSHLLGPLAGRVLEVLLETDRALSVEDIVTALGDELAPPDTFDPHPAIDVVLSEFQRLGLAEPEKR